jgi:two-component system CheB/CheR fusion protein
MAKNFAESIVDTVREPLLVLDADLKVISANQVFYQTFHTSKEETEHRPIYELGDGQWDIPKLRGLLEEIIHRDISFKDFEVEHDFPRIGHKIMLLNGRRIPPMGKHSSMILLAIEDCTAEAVKDQEHLKTIARLEKEMAELKGKG